MLKKLLKFKIVSLINIASLVLILGAIFWAYMALQGIKNPLIIHFNDLVGINQVGGLSDLLWLGLTGLIIAIINFFISLEFEERNRFLGKLMSVATLTLSILIFISFAAIIGVN